MTVLIANPQYWRAEFYNVLLVRMSYDNNIHEILFTELTYTVFDLTENEKYQVCQTL
jgi:hypothetical protein